MKEAIDLSLSNLESRNGGPFGACVVKDGKTVGKGANAVIKNNDPTAHAEICAIRDACNNLNTYDLSGCEIYTSCYPCPMCLSAIIWSNIKVVYYGNTKEDAANIGFRDDFIYNYINNGLNDESILKMKSINHEEALEAFNKYMEENDRVVY